MNETHSMLREALRRFLTDQYGALARRAILASPQGWCSSIWSQLAELGLLAARLPPAHGGLGGDGEELLILMEGFGRSLLLEPYVSSIVIGGRLFEELGDSGKLDGIAQGTIRTALAHEESPFERDAAAIATTAGATKQGYLLNGRKILVRDTPSATHFIVSAVNPTKQNQSGEKALALFLVPAGTSGMSVDSYPLIDGSRCGDIEFRDALVPANAQLVSGETTLPLLHRLLNDATLAVCAEAIGVMREMLEQTVTYLNQRMQFGKPLSSFQVLQHRLVDMVIEIEQAQSLTLRAALTQADAAGVSAAKIRVNRAVQTVAQGAVQLHGGIGTTEELPLSQYFRRATAIERQYGTSAQHYARVERLLKDELNGNAAPMIERAEPESDGAFRMQVRQFLQTALTAELREEADRQVSVFAEPALAAKWHRILYEKGWIAPNWPVAHGGTGWTAAQRCVFEHECALANTPLLPAMGLQMCGPVLIGHGTEQQKAFFLPRILSGEHFWCQGYSEPAAGSDLASLKTSAVRDGEDYIVNGTKIWTTYAHVANWIFMLVRTDPQGKPQAGISFLLVSLDTPGITLQPIRSISGEHEVNQLFFDNVRVPIANRVGEENQGWTVAKYLLEFERGGGSPTGRAIRVIGALRRFARQSALQPDILHRLSQLEIEIAATDWTQRRMLADVQDGRPPGNTNASILKLKASELYQQASVLYLDALGGWGLAEQRGSIDRKAETRGPAHALTGAARYMNSRAMSIFGGSSEIQRGIIAKEILGL